MIDSSAPNFKLRVKTQKCTLLSSKTSLNNIKITPQSVKKQYKLNLCMSKVNLLSDKSSPHILSQSPNKFKQNPNPILNSNRLKLKKSPSLNKT